jgi:hypothetical protein
MKASLEPRKCKLDALRQGPQAEPGHDRPRALRQGHKRLPEGLQPLDWLALDDSGRLGKRSFKPTKSSCHHAKAHVKKSKPELPEPWTHDEDELLLALVLTHGHQKWSNVAKKMAGREGKQCRERWHNHLSPSIKKSAWTEAEQWVLFLVTPR